MPENHIEGETLAVSPRRRILPGAAAIERLRPVVAAAGIAGCVASVSALNLLPPPFGLTHVLMVLGALLSLTALAFLEVVRKPLAGVDERLEQIRDAHWELADNEARYRQLLDTQNDLIVRRRSTGELVFVNRAYCDAFGVTHDMLIGSRFMPVVLVAEPQPQPIDAAVPSRRCTVELMETVRGQCWIAWEEHRAAASDGDFEVQRVGRDVTGQRRADADLREARDQADAANRAKSRFLASMSHEIRTPMTGILGMASLLADTALTPDQTDYTRAIDQSAHALLALIDEILDFSKIEAGKLKLAKDPFSLRTCVTNAMELLAPRAADKGLSLDWSIAQDVPELLAGDEARVRQILLNLVSNAVKFTEQGIVDVTVSLVNVGWTSAASVRLAITVKDTGIGISAETMQRLFDEFEQAEPAPGRRGGGTGLGLAISKRLARAMGGDITAEGALGHGTTFTAVLNLGRADEVKVVAPELPLSPGLERVDHNKASRPFVKPPDFAQSRPGRGGGSGPWVLIAEDNDINALLARRVIEMANGSAQVVGNGRAAIAAAVRSLEPGAAPFDLILMDVFMPDIDGLEATKAIKSLFALRKGDGFVPPPIVALTANAFAEDRERCLAAGMDDYLAKPFDTRHLRDLLARWVPERTQPVNQIAPKPAA